MRAAAADTKTIGPGAVSARRRAQRNPSTTPAIGLIPYTVRQGSESRLLGYAIGVMNSHICVRKGIVYLTSRYLTCSAASHMLTASTVVTASRNSSGNAHKA